VGSDLSGTPSERLLRAGRLIWLSGGETEPRVVGVAAVGTGDGSKSRLAAFAWRGTSLDAAPMAAAKFPAWGSSYPAYTSTFKTPILGGVG
jgi:hypothetical protein